MIGDALKKAAQAMTAEQLTEEIKTATQNEVTALNQSAENKDAFKDSWTRNLVPHQFQPGQSGNPGGRPKKKRITEAYEELLDDAEFRELVKTSVRKAISSGRMVAMFQLKEMAERTEGKVKEEISVSGDMSLLGRMERARQVVSDVSITQAQVIEDKESGGECRILPQPKDEPEK